MCLFVYDLHVCSSLFKREEGKAGGRRVATLRARKVYCSQRDFSAVVCSEVTVLGSLRLPYLSACACVTLCL